MHDYIENAEFSKQGVQLIILTLYHNQTSLGQPNLRPVLEIS